MKKNILCAFLLVIAMLCLTACKQEEVEKETLPPENINSLLDKYGEESGDETQKVANNSEETTASINTSGGHNSGNQSDSGNNQNNSGNNDGDSANGQAGNANANTNGNSATNISSTPQTSGNTDYITTKNNTTKPTTSVAKEETTTRSLKVEVSVNTDISIATTPRPSGGTIIIGGGEETTTSPQVTSGIANGSVKWKLEGSTLTIYGSGEMADYNYASTTPWYTHRASIKSIVVSSGITYIGKSAFGNSYTAVEYVTIADTVTKIGPNAFFNCSSLKEIKMSNQLVSAGDDCFRQCESLEKINLPATFTDAGSFLFQNSYPTIYGVAGSYAQTYVAPTYRLNFVAQ